MLTDIQIEGLIKQFIDSILKYCEESRLCGYGLPADEADLSNAIDIHDKKIAEYRAALAFNQIKSVEHIVNVLIQLNSLTIEKQSEDYNKLSREVLKALMEVMQIETERLKGNYDNPYDKMLTSSPVSSRIITNGERPSKVLADFIDEYSREKISKKDWRPKTQAENARIYNLLQSILTDILNVHIEDISLLDRSILIKYAKVLSKLPAYMNKKKAFRDLSVREIYEAILRKPVKPMSTRSYNKHLESVSAMFKWAVKLGYMERNPAESLTVKEDRVESEEHDAYNKDDLQRLFSCPVYASPNPKEPEKFFIPLIALYGGLRLEEVCQLYREDISEIDGVFLIDITNDNDNRLKTPSSKRIVPLHKALIDLGFLRYWKTVKGIRLWENLQKGRNGYGDAFGRWYQRLNRKHITKDKKRVFHSFRHTFIINLKQQGVSETVIAELVSHASDSITLGRHRKKYNVDTLLDAVNKLDYGIDLSGLKFPL